MKARKLTHLEKELLIYCYQTGYKWAALNGQSVRVFDTDKKPHLNHRVHLVKRDDGMTELGAPIIVPKLFKDVGYYVLDLSEIQQQISLF